MSAEEAAHGPEQLLREERQHLAARRRRLEAVLKVRSPQCYVRGIDRALKDRDDELRAYLREHTSVGAERSGDEGADATLPALAGIALSGGGVRSASFNLGVLQRLHELGLLQKADYLSTVSGGGYIGCSLVAYDAARAAPPPEPQVAAARAAAPAFPFEHEFKRPENIVIRHLRRFSSFLVARGWIDALVAAMTAIGGMLANVLILAPWLLLLAILMVWPLECPPIENPLWLLRAGAGVLVGVAAILAFVYAAAQARVRAGGWALRESAGRRTAVAAGMCLATAVLLVQPLLIMQLVGVDWRAAATGGGAASVLAGLARLMLPKLRGPVRIAIVGVLAFVLLWAAFLALGAVLYRYSCAGDFAEAAGVAGAIALMLFLGARFLPANCGSLHGFYRDRLSKAYFFEPTDPGATRLKHYESCQLSALPFDNVPYLLANACLNVSDAPGPDDDLAEEYVRPGRKGTFFLFSRLGVGSDGLGYVAADRFERENELQSSLATAMGISGAAFGPNMGYSTRPAAVLLLTLLNVRTGAWMSFPWKKAPGEAVSTPWLEWFLGDYAYLTLVREAQSRFDNANRHGRVLLSDGGHVDNLGVYQLLKRRCMLIITSDAEADPAYAFEGLAASVRLADIDLGVKVRIPYEHLAGIAEGKRHFAVGEIDYGDGVSGTLIYLKSSMTDEARRNVFLLNYQRANPAFPHEPTSDQFFTEQQFEAYRALGYFVCEKVFAGPS